MEVPLFIPWDSKVLGGFPLPLAAHSTALAALNCLLGLHTGFQGGVGAGRARTARCELYQKEAKVKARDSRPMNGASPKMACQHA
eukprot:1157778-Pelagomonas_calceolata.AAC.16